MTYLVAWKRRETAFLSADSVLSSDKPPEHFDVGPMSTFGELDVLDRRYREETALKIVKFDQIAIHGLAGA